MPTARRPSTRTPPRPPAPNPAPRGAWPGGGGLRSVYGPRETAQRLTGQPGQVATIEVAGEPGVSVSDLVDAITPLLPERAEAVSAQAVAEQNAEPFQEALGFLNTFLLVFAGVALFVGAFLIQNTFRIVVAQRVRELALLRVVGATRRQVTRMVVLEEGI